MTGIWYNDEYYEGMACSREFAEWLLRMNDTLGFPVKSYYKLIRLFCRTQYKELLMEEERKANEFFYRLNEKDGKLTLESSYEMVFLPYEEDVRSFAPIHLNGIVLGYRVLQTRGYLPGDYYNNLAHDYDSMRYIVDLFTNRNEVAKKFEVKDGNYIDVYKLAEFQNAEESFFIDNQMPYSFGPSCPDRMLCYNSHFNVLSHLMDDVDSLHILGKDCKHYELRLVSVVSELLSIKWDKEGTLDKKKLLDTANERYMTYLLENEQNDSLDKLCENIRAGYKKRVIIGIDYSAGVEFDVDWDDMETAPVGLTDKDYKRFSNCNTITSTLEAEDTE